MTIEFAARLRRIPVYPAADGYALPEDVALLASNESPDPPLPAVVEAAQRALAAANRYPDPTSARCAARLADRYGVPRQRIAHRQRLLRHPARRRRGAARARRRARLRVAVLQRLPAPRGRLRRHARSRSRSTTDDRHDLDAMATEITAATRLVIVCNPNNPTSTALPLRRDRGLRRARPAPRRVILDEAYCEFNLLDDPDASLDLLDRAPEPRAAADVLEGLRPVRAARRLRAVRLARSSRTAVDQVRQPFFCNAAAQAAAVEALKPPGRGRRARRARPSPRGMRVDGGPARARHRARRVAGQLRLVRPARGRRRGRGRRRQGLAERGVLVRAGGALGRAGRAARDLRHRGRERALPRRACATLLNLLRHRAPDAVAATATPAFYAYAADSGAGARGDRWSWRFS